MNSARAAALSLASLASLMLWGCSGPTAPHVDAGVLEGAPDVPGVVIEPVRPDQVCPAAKKALADSLAQLNNTCASDSECALFSVQLEPCRIGVAFPTALGDIVNAHRDVVRDTRSICGIPHPPCPAALGHAACDAGRCVAREGMAPPVVPTWEGLLSSEEGPIANVPVKAALFSQPQCVTVPCNAMNAGEMSLRTDARGVLRVRLDGATEGNRIAMSDPDYAMLTLEGYEVQRVNLGPTAQPVPIRLRKR